MPFWNSVEALSLKQQHRWVVTLFDGSSNPDKDKIGLPHYLIKSVDKPTYEISSVQAKYLYAHTFNFPKRLSWKPITLTLYDTFLAKEDFQLKYAKNYKNKGTTIEGGQSEKRASSESILYRMLLEAGYFSPQDEDEQLFQYSYHFKQNLIKSLVSPVGSEKSFKDKFTIENSSLKKYWMEIKHLDGDGKTGDDADVWQLYNPIISDYRTDKLDYASDAASTLTLTIYYDWAKLIPGNKASIDFKLLLYKTEGKERKETNLFAPIPEKPEKIFSAQVNLPGIESARFVTAEELAKDLKAHGQISKLSESIVTVDGKKFIQVEATKDGFTFYYRLSSEEASKAINQNKDLREAFTKSPEGQETRTKEELFDLGEFEKPEGKGKKSKQNIEIGALSYEKNNPYRDIDIVARDEVARATGLSSDVPNDLRLAFSRYKDNVKDSLKKGEIVLSDGSTVKLNFGESTVEAAKLSQAILTQKAIDLVFANGGVDEYGKPLELKKAGDNLLINNPDGGQLFIPRSGETAVMAAMTSTQKGELTDEAKSAARKFLSSAIIEDAIKTNALDRLGITGANIPNSILTAANDENMDDQEFTALVLKGLRETDAKSYDEFLAESDSLGSSLRNRLQLGSESLTEDAINKKAREFSIPLNNAAANKDRERLESELFGSDKLNVLEDPNYTPPTATAETKTTPATTADAKPVDGKAADGKTPPGDGKPPEAKQPEVPVIPAKPSEELIDLFGSDKTQILSTVLTDYRGGKSLPFVRSEFEEGKYTAIIDGKEVTIDSRQFKALDEAAEKLREEFLASQKPADPTPVAAEKTGDEKPDASKKDAAKETPTKPTGVSTPASGEAGKADPSAADKKASAKEVATKAPAVADPSGASSLQSPGETKTAVSRRYYTEKGTKKKIYTGATMNYTIYLPQGKTKEIPGIGKVGPGAGSTDPEYITKGKLGELSWDDNTGNRTSVRIPAKKANVLVVGDSLSYGMYLASGKNAAAISAPGRHGSQIAADMRYNFDLLEAAAKSGAKVIVSTGTANSFAEIGSKGIFGGKTPQARGILEEAKMFLAAGIKPENVYILGVSPIQGQLKNFDNYKEEYGQTNNAALQAFANKYGFHFTGIPSPSNIVGDKIHFTADYSAYLYRQILAGRI